MKYLAIIFGLFAIIGLSLVNAKPRYEYGGYRNDYGKLGGGPRETQYEDLEQFQDQSAFNKGTKNVIDQNQKQNALNKEDLYNRGGY